MNRIAAFSLAALLSITTATAQITQVPAPQNEQKANPYPIVSGVMYWKANTKERKLDEKYCATHVAYMMQNVLKAPVVIPTARGVVAAIGDYSINIFCVEKVRMTTLSVAGPEEGMADKIYNFIAEKL